MIEVRLQLAHGVKLGDCVVVANGNKVEPFLRRGFHGLIEWARNFLARLT